jgi:hypothetical protein
MSPTMHFWYRYGRPLGIERARAVVMASNDNTRPRPVEMLIDASRSTIVRRRETLQGPGVRETTA